MSTAWKIVIALTLARAAMAVQFQALPALAGPLTEGGMSYAALGTLTGAYLLPGVAAALAGGWMGHRVGDIRTALVGLGLMVAGGIGEWAAPGFSADLVFRLVAGTGAVALNVMVTKMLADWFQGRDDLTTAMGVLVSSWPAGIALAMLVLPPLAAALGLGAALLLPVALAGMAFAGLALSWSPPPGRMDAARGARPRLSRRELGLVLLAGSIWGLYNVALIAAIAWIPGLFESAGIAPVPAAAAVSFVGWAAIFSVALGGWLAARAPWRDLPTVLSFILCAAFLLALPGTGQMLANTGGMILLGLLFGPPAALIMTLPVAAARAELRAVAMGIYLAVYYGAMALGPVVLGALREAGDSAAPLVAAAGALILCFGLLVLFRKLVAQASQSGDRNASTI